MQHVTGSRTHLPLPCAPARWLALLAALALGLTACGGSEPADAESGAGGGSPSSGGESLARLGVAGQGVARWLPGRYGVDVDCSVAHHESGGQPVSDEQRAGLVAMNMSLRFGEDGSLTIDLGDPPVPDQQLVGTWRALGGDQLEISVPPRPGEPAVASQGRAVLDDEERLVMAGPDGLAMCYRRLDA